MGALERSGTLSESDRKKLDEIYKWFKTHLKVPTRLSVSSRPHSQAQAISWFKDTATEHIAKMRETQKVLERYGVAVHMVKARRLGYVLYEDEFQAAAYPFKDTRT